MTDKEYVEDLEGLVHFLAEIYEKVSQTYLYENLKTASKRKLTKAEQSEINRFPLIQGHKLQRIVRELAQKEKPNPKNLEQTLVIYQL